MNLITPLKSTVSVEPPSIVEQAQAWGSCRIVDFQLGKPTGTEYFNCPLTNHSNRDWLLVRRSKFDPKIHVGLNDLVAFSMSDLNPQLGYPLATMKHSPAEHNEDPRCFRHDGHTYVSACTFLWYAETQRWTGAHQAVWKLNDRWECKERFDPIYGCNMATNSAKLGNEKNWLFFVNEGRLFMLYKSEPFTIVEFDWKFNAIQEYKTEFNHAWAKGEIRGGSNPVIGPDGLFWTFFHSSLIELKNDKRRYYMGALAFSPKPPYNVVKMTTEPLLCGSKKDRWYQDKPAVVFPGSALLKGSKWIVPLGVNDLDSAIAEIEHENLLILSSPV